MTLAHDDIQPGPDTTSPAQPSSDEGPSPPPPPRSRGPRRMPPRGFLPPDIRERLLTHPQAAELLGLPERSLEAMKKNGRIPFVRLPGSRTVRYRLSSLMQLIEEAERQVDTT